MLWLLIAALSEIKNCGVVPSFQKKKKKKMKTDMQFKAYQQERNMILDLGKLNLFKSGRGSFPPPPVCRLTTRLNFYNQIGFCNQANLIIIC